MAQPGKAGSASARKGASAPDQPNSPDGNQPGELPPEVRARVAALRAHIQLSVGQIVLTMVDLPRYRHQTLADLHHLLINPLLRDRIAIAQRRAAEGADEAIAGIAIWASVSAEVDAKITDQIKAGVFPVRLGAEDWTSGDQPWLLDVIAPDREAASLVLANFRQVTGERAIKVHPIVARLVDPALIERLRERT